MTKVVFVISVKSALFMVRHIVKQQKEYLTYVYWAGQTYVGAKT